MRTRTSEKKTPDKHHQCTHASSSSPSSAHLSIMIIISISSHIEYYTRQVYYSFVFYSYFQYSQESKLIKQNHRIAFLFIGVCVCLLNKIQLSIASFSLLFSYNYSKKEKEEKLLTSYDFTFVGKDRLKQNNHRTYLHFIQLTVLCMYIYIRVRV
jgi:hypothetical protein